MIVLVVDDQTSVVNGIVFGVDWRALGVDKVLKAYNAFEAKEILSREHVDILLSDIEMPVENGLELLRWIKERDIPLECIFLTAHADFIYLRQAMQLGSFDYILQPARYKDIEQAVERAILNLKNKRERQKYYDYGKSHYHDKGRLVDALLRDWFLDHELKEETLRNDLAKIGIASEAADGMYMALLSLAGREPGLGSSELERRIQEKASALFAPYGQTALVVQLSKRDYGLVLYPHGRFFLDEQGAVRQLELLIEAFPETGMACYAAAAGGHARIPDCVRQLEGMRRNNVALASKVFVPGAEHGHADTAGLPNMKVWGNMLLGNGASAVRDQSVEWLEAQSAAGKLSAPLLKRFYQEFMQMLYNVLEQMGHSVKDIFPDDELLDRALTSYSSIEDMRGLLHYIADYFEASPEGGEKNKNQIEQIIHYIRSNLDKDIRRADIADAVYLNPSYVSRLFRQETGMSLKEFITSEKMKMAQALLRTTELPISVVAVKMGFANFSHFSQVYKKYMGLTPAEDRKR